MMNQNIRLKKMFNIEKCVHNALYEFLILRDPVK